MVVGRASGFGGDRKVTRKRESGKNGTKNEGGRVKQYYCYFTTKVLASPRQAKTQVGGEVESQKKGRLPFTVTGTGGRRDKRSCEKTRADKA